MNQLSGGLPMSKRKHSSPLPAESSIERPAQRWTRRAALALSLALCAGLSFCYALRPDSCAAVTVWPVWTWITPGVLLTVPAWNRPGKRAAALVIALWFVYLLALAEEPGSLARFGSWPDPAWQAARKRGAALRVISLNCAGGDPNAAEEVAQYDPDIVLLQESPGRKEVEALARRLFGEKAGVIWGVDASLLARGRVRAEDLPASLRSFCAQARVRLEAGPEVEVVSLRLLPSVFRADLWSPDCWRVYAEDRRARLEQIRSLLPNLHAVPKDVPLLVGGDFNAPAGDAVCRHLPPRLRDTFSIAGQGWGDTITNDFPALRIDQVWADEWFCIASVVARKTRYSDHRMVICDLFLR
jgi:vancomycin resistance protein VanJ